jgi:selenocysteine-specific elongation factor
VYLVGAERLEPGETGLAEIRLEQPTVAVPGDRFIVRQYSPMRTIGGGQVLESVDRKRRRLQDPAVVARLERLSVADGTDRVRLLVEESSLKAITESEIVARTGSAPDAIRAELDALVEGDEVRRLGAGSGTVMTEAAFGDAAARVMRAVETFHREHPLEAGISREALLVGAIPEASSLVFDFVLGELVRSERIETAKEIVHLHGRRVELRADEEELRDAILAALAGYGIEVPEIGEVLQTAGIDPGKTRTILQFMVRDRSVARISDSLIVDQRVIDDLVARLRERKSTNPNLGVGDFKDLAGVTRKYAIPLLEYFDRIRVTRRNGNDRLIL